MRSSVRSVRRGWRRRTSRRDTRSLPAGCPMATPVSSLNTPSAQQQQAREQLQRSLGNLNLAAQSIAAQRGCTGCGTASGVGRSFVGARWSRRWRSSRRHQFAERRLAQRPGTGAIARHRRSHHGHHSTDRRSRDPQLGDLQRRQAHHGRFQAAGRLGRAQPRQRSAGAALADPGPDQGRWHGADRRTATASYSAASSQTDTRNLVAAAARIGDEQFKTRGIYSAQANGAYTPSFTDADGKVEVQAGARINTTPPTTVTQGGGYALLLGKEVVNAGAITTPRGQVQMAAGDFFIVRPGQSTTATSTRPRAATRSRRSSMPTARPARSPTPACCRRPKAISRSRGARWCRTAWPCPRRRSTRAAPSIC